MKRVIFRDRTYIIVSDEQAELLAQMKVNKQASWINHKAGRDFVDAADIVRISQAQRDDLDGIDESHRIEAPKTERADGTGPGYKSFLAQRERLFKKHGIPTTKRDGGPEQTGLSGVRKHKV